MRRALGPFLATGVALVAATVVVANPVAPPSRDMQISTTQLSTSPDLLSPSDKSLLSALTPQLPIAGIGSALAQILAALAADADRISREVASEVGGAAPVAAAVPEQTAYRPEPMAVESPSAAPMAAVTTIATPVVSPDVVQALSGLVTDTSYLGGKVVEAAYAVVDVIIRVPEFGVTAVLDLLNGDIAGALDTVKSVIKTFFGSGLIILDGIGDVLRGRQPTPVPPPSAALRKIAQATGSGTEESESPSTSRLSSGGKAGSARKHVGPPSPAALRLTGTPPKAAASSDQTTSDAKKHTGSSKPATGSTRSTGGSARNLKSGADASTD